MKYMYTTSGSIKDTSKSSLSLNCSVVNLSSQCQTWNDSITCEHAVICWHSENREIKEISPWVWELGALIMWHAIFTPVHCVRPPETN